MVLTTNNSEILHRIAEVRRSDSSHRFVVVGSLARSAALGADMTTVSDPQGRRFKDVDVIDRSNLLAQRYAFGSGILDARPTQSVRPLQHDETTWGFFDRTNPDDQEPLTTFPEASLGLHPVAVSTESDSEVTTLDISAQLVLSNIYAYSHNMPKHHDQLKLLQKQAGTPDAAIQEAYAQYIEEMRLKYPLNGYSRARQIFFNTIPSIAMLAKESKVGDAVRAARGTRIATIPLAAEEFSIT